MNLRLSSYTLKKKKKVGSCSWRHTAALQLLTVPHDDAGQKVFIYWNSYSSSPSSPRHLITSPTRYLTMSSFIQRSWDSGSEEHEEREERSYEVASNQDTTISALGFYFKVTLQEFRVCVCVSRLQGVYNTPLIEHSTDLGAWRAASLLMIVE